MKREEQIEQKAKELGQKYFPNEYNIWARPNYEAQYVEFACKEMMEWADGHPSQDQIDALRMEYEKGRADAIAHPSGGELLYVLNKGYEQGYKEATDKAFDWLIERYENQGVILLDDIYELKQRMEEQQ